MSLAKINSWFESIGRFQIRHRAFFIIGIILFSILGLAGLSHFALEDNQESWFGDADQIKINSDHFEDIFGNDDVIMVLVEAPDVFAPEVLDAIDRVGKRLVAEVPYADSVTSIMDVSVTKGTDDGFEVVNPFEDGIPGGGKPFEQMTEEEKAELAEKKSFILSRDSLVNNLVSADATETWVIVKLLPFEDDTADQYIVGEAAIPIMESDEFKSDAYTMKASGMSYTETEERAVVNHEAILRVVSGFIVMLLCLIFFVRSLRGVLIPLIATVFGIGSTLGFSSWFGVIGDSTLITLPILLGMALSVGYAIHYITSFKMFFRKTGARRESAITAVSETGWPILFTVITTIGSMISFMTVGIGPLKWLGGTCAAVIFSVYLYVIILIPILMSFGKDAPINTAESVNPKALEKQTKANIRAEKIDNQLQVFGERVLQHKISIILVSVVISIVALFGIFKMNVNMDYLEMMGKRIPYVERILSILDSTLGSQYSYNVLIESDREDAFKDPEYINALEKSMNELGKLRLTRISGDKPRVTSVVDIVKEMNRTLNSDDPAFYTIPQDQDLLTQELFLYEISGGDGLSDWLTDDYSTSYVHIELAGYDANKVSADIDDAVAIVERNFPDAKVSIVGVVVNFAEMNNKLVTGELKSFLGSFIIIAIMLIVAFGSITTGLIGMIPNLTPVLIVGGIMGHVGFSLDMLTMTIMPMILGIAVDDTIHFMNHTKYLFERTGNYRDAILGTYKEIGRAMLMTTIILCAMFLMYTFSPLNTLFRVGLLAMIGLGAALVADYTLTPVLVYITKPFGKERV